MTFIKACQNNVPSDFFIRKFHLKSNIQDGFMDHSKAEEVEDCKYHKDKYGSTRNRHQHKKKHPIRHKQPPFKIYPRRGPRKIHKKIPPHLDIWGEYLVLYKTNLFEENKKFGEDPEDSMVFSSKKKIFEISSHDLVKENVKNVYR